MEPRGPLTGKRGAMHTRAGWIRTYRWAILLLVALVKRPRLLFFFLPFLILPHGGSLWAANYAPRPHYLEVAVKYSYLDYKEGLPDPLKSVEKGFLPTFRGAYGYRGVSNPVYLRFLFEYTDSRTDFDGTTQAGLPVSDVKTWNRFVTGEANIGYTIKAPSPDFPVDTTFYTGYGYRYWKRGLGGSFPFSEDYRWQYVPLGVRGAYRISQRWTGEFDLALWILFGANIQVNLTDLDPRFNNPRQDLGNKLGWKFELPFNYRISRRWSLELAPYYEYYALGQSEKFAITFDGAPAGEGYEPDSRTHWYGMRLGLKLHF